MITSTTGAGSIENVEKLEDFTAVLTLPMSPSDVAALFSTPEGISRWWGPTEGDAAEGGTFVTSFGHHGVNAHRVVTTRPDRVVWESIEPSHGRPTAHVAEWLGTRIEIDIQPTEGGTQLHFRHAGLTPTLSCYQDCFDAWTHFMSSIQSYAATGVGAPFAS